MFVCARHYRNPLTFILLAQQSHEENEAQRRHNWTAVPAGGRAGIYSRRSAARTDWPEAPHLLSLTASPCPAPGLMVKGNPVLSTRVTWAALAQEIQTRGQPYKSLPPNPTEEQWETQRGNEVSLKTWNWISQRSSALFPLHYMNILH